MILVRAIASSQKMSTDSLKTGETGKNLKHMKNLTMYKSTKLHGQIK